MILPLSLLFGGAFLALTDVVARTAAAPAEMPIGVVTAFFGGPFFVLVLRTAETGERYERGRGARTRPARRPRRAGRSCAAST